MTQQLLTELVSQGTYTQQARQTHQLWKTAKTAQGWQYGPKRDYEAKTNPLLVEFEDLPPEIRGQNSLTPYAVMNYFRTKATTNQELKTMLKRTKNNPAELDNLAEYVHSHFIAGLLARGESVQTRDDMAPYELLPEDVKSWDRETALGTVEYIQQKLGEI